MPWLNYFELKWTSSLAENMVGGVPTLVTRRFRMQMDNANHAMRRSLTGVTYNLNGQLMVVREAFRPREVHGVVRIDEYPPTVDPWGSLADLEEAAGASDLSAKMYADSAFWAAFWANDFIPASLDPQGRYWLVQVELRQKQ